MCPVFCGNLYRRVSKLQNGRTRDKGIQFPISLVKLVEKGFISRHIVNEEAQALRSHIWNPVIHTSAVLTEPSWFLSRVHIRLPQVKSPSLMVHDLVVVGIGVIDAVGHVVHFVGREAGCDPESIDWPSVKVIEELEF